MSPLSDVVLHSPDMVFISPSTPSRPPGGSHRSSAATSLRTFQPHAVHSTPQSPSQAQDLQQADDSTRVRFLTPPSTPALQRPATPNTVASHTTPTTTPHLRGRVASHRRQEYRPASISGPQSHCHTSIYSLLAEADMLDYFGMDYGISKRPPQGTSCSFVGTVQLLTDSIR